MVSRAGELLLPGLQVLVLTSFFPLLALVLGLVSSIVMFWLVFIPGHIIFLFRFFSEVNDSLANDLHKTVPDDVMQVSE